MLKYLFLFLLALCSVPVLSMQAQISEDEAVKFVKNLSPSILDSTLPEGHFSVWLASVIGDSAMVQWELNDCGEQTGDPGIDKDRDVPSCVGIYVTFPDRRSLGLTIIVGTSRKGLTGHPAIYDLYLESKGTSVGVKRLRDLPVALKKSAG